MKKIKVIMNYDNNKVEYLKVGIETSRNEIESIVRKKYGNYDVLRWEEILPEETVEVEEPEDDLF